ncbi:macrophage receptor MARCO-like isoform X1 [Montipora capricornis]|uniref:macrophage receptor MARCO-like isoform X1 n=1 Tax=Montipora capricornis TaxID=246305 RepID=UPI0035F20CBE
MNQQGKTRARLYAENFGIAMAALYIILTTVFMVTLYRVAVAQTAQIHSLESVTGELADRVRMLENSFTAQTSRQESVGETEEKFKRPNDKLALADALEQEREKRQIEGSCTCPKGRRGKKGKKGHKGDQGPKGEHGQKGEPGLDGPTGPTGVEGPQGKAGPQGIKGLRGDPGVAGPQGDKGEPGKGLKGDRGIQGPKGDEGSEGLRGERGAPGDKGDPGVDGPKGNAGAIGSQGQKGIKGETGVSGLPGARGLPGVDGSKGEKGMPGTSMTESIHLVGDGTRINNPISRRTVNNWQVRHKSDGLMYSKGAVHIRKAGYYYVYSQMYYHDETAYQMAHQLYVNAHKFMQSRSTVANKGRGYNPGYNTNYNGGIVFLNVSDYISVRTPFSRYYSMDPEYSYFGAFMIHPAQI